MKKKIYMYSLLEFYSLLMRVDRSLFNTILNVKLYSLYLYFNKKNKSIVSGNKYISVCKKFTFTKEYKRNYNLSKEQKEALIGIILDDGYLERWKIIHNMRLRVEQTYPTKESYLLSIFELFKPLVARAPKIVIIKSDIRTGKIYKSIAFKTFNMPCLNSYYDLFYKGKIKVIPDNIHELLTPRGLAYWIMDDGGKSIYDQTILHTISYSEEEVILLQNALNINFKLRTHIEKKKINQWVIYIPVIQDIPLK